MKKKTEEKNTSRLFTIEETKKHQRGLYTCLAHRCLTGQIYFLLFLFVVYISWSISENLTKIVNLSITIYFSEKGKVTGSKVNIYGHY